MADIHRCNRCGNLLPSDAPEGTCPACMLRAGLEPDTTPPPDGSAGGDATFSFEPVQPGHVLESLARSIGSIPRLLLPDTAPDDAGVAITKPSSNEAPAPAERGGRYQLFGEIARGGMGAVIKGRDPDLGRDLAVKVLLESHDDNPDMLRRFVEEAQIGGQLQHPGIVPVYELGTFADRRLYFTMKLVKGRTLSALPGERGVARDQPTDTDLPTLRVEGESARRGPGPNFASFASPPVGEDQGGGAGLRNLPRFLSIFEAICQTMAYAHARGVIHRDLKPSNVMVGRFGEVQVMDWGLAKVLKEGRVADEATVQPAPEESLVATVRSGSNLDESQAGSVMGTPAYMAPEQAAGEGERVDRRADVFGLGSILCEILTGQPAFTGRGAMEVLRTAMRCETADALARLDGCGAEAELIALAKDCLAVEPEDRPRDAGLVAERITAYLAGVQDRVQAAERERAVAVARAIEERRRRKVQLALAASVLALTTLGGLSTMSYLQQRQARAAAGQRVVDQVTTLRAQALAQPEEIQRWELALAAVEQADPAGDPKTKTRLVALQKEIQAGLHAAKHDKALLDRLVDIRSAKADDPDGSITHHDYAEAFREVGLDLSALPPAEAGARIKSRPPGVAQLMAAALDDWSDLLRSVRRDPSGAARLDEIAQVADPDRWRNNLRDALTVADKDRRVETLKSLAGTAQPDKLGAVSFDLLGKALFMEGDLATAEAVLRRAQLRYSGDVWINYDLARVLERREHRDDAIRFYTAARAIRPETAHELAHALSAKGETKDAIDVFRELTRLRPRDGHLICLGMELNNQGRLQEAVAVFEQIAESSRAAIRIRPDDANAHKSLGVALGRQGKLDDANAELRTAIRLLPDQPDSHFNLGDFLANQGKLDDAIGEYREAIRLSPNYARAHANLAIALAGQGKLDESIASSRAAIQLERPNAGVHTNLGIALMEQGKLEEAIAEFREAIRIDPSYPGAYTSLGTALANQGKLDEAITACRKAIRINPDFANAHIELGVIFCDRLRDFPAAEREFRLAVRLKPKDEKAHINLGIALEHQRNLNEALAEFRMAQRLASPNSPVAQGASRMIHRLEPLVAQAGRLPAVLGGNDKPKDNAERLIFTQLAHASKHFAAAARLWAEAFEVDPASASDLEAANRYSAACAAALAGAAQGKDDPPCDEAARSRSRTQARNWLRADLGLRTQQLDTGNPQDRAAVAQALQYWKQDTDLAGIRDALALAKLLEAEQKEWRTFWSEVDSLLKRVATSKAQETKPDGSGKVQDPAVPSQPKPSVAGQEPRPPANPKPKVEPDNPEALASIHKLAHELAPSKPDEAEPLFRRALEGYRKTQADGMLTLDLTLDLAGLLDRTGRGAEAEPLFREGLDAARKRFGPNDLRTAGIMAVFGNSLVQQGKWTAAEPVLRDCLAIREKTQTDDWTTFNTRSTLGGSLLGQKKYAEAEPLIVSGYEGMKAREAKIPPPGKPRFTEAAERVVKLYEAWGKNGKAAEWRAKLAKPSGEREH
ncbi:MAG: tetratricopeptide repeat protein [Isosphaerales bacterium]